MGCGCKKKKPRAVNSTDKEKRIKEAMRSYMDFKKGNAKQKTNPKKSGN